MGTRGAITRATPNGFEGRYHHWDSYPSGLGKTLWDLYHGHFKGDLKAMLELLIDEHPAGWSTINDKDFSLKAGFIEYTARELQRQTKKARKPLCYCHGDRSEKEWLITQNNASGSGVEWVYTFDEDLKTMTILASYCGYSEDMKNVKMIGAFGCGDKEAEWRTIVTVNLDGTEPNWEEIETDVRDASEKAYQENQKKKTERFLETIKEGYAKVKEYGLIAIPQAWFTSWYKEDVSEHLDMNTKIEVAKRISELTLRSPIWEDRKTNYIEQFPELAPFSNTRHISGLQLCAVMQAIVEEIRQNARKLETSSD